jgi:hypothetical protein
VRRRSTSESAVVHRRRSRPEFTFADDCSQDAEDVATARVPSLSAARTSPDLDPPSARAAVSEAAGPAALKPKAPTTNPLAPRRPSRARIATSPAAVYD